MTADLTLALTLATSPLCTECKGRNVELLRRTVSDYALRGSWEHHDGRWAIVVYREVLVERDTEEPLYTLWCKDCRWEQNITDDVHEQIDPAYSVPFGYRFSVQWA